MRVSGIPLANPAEAATPDRRRAEAEALTNDVVAGIEQTVRVWNKAHNPTRATLAAGEHTIAVLQGIVICAGQQAAALAVANPDGDPEWLRTHLMESFAQAFDDVRAAAEKTPAGHG